jgi:hypothetical protein
MGNPYPCFECQAIADEFRSACAEIEASPSLSEESRAAYEALLVLVAGTEPRLSAQSRAAHDAVRGMIGGTEEDAERAEEFLVPYQFRTQGPELFRTDVQCRHPKLFDVIRRMALHRGRTGHLPLAHL